MRIATPAIALVALVPLVLANAGCERRREEPLPPPPPAVPASIWTASDAREVASQLVDAATRDAWSSQFRDRNNRAARIAVGEVADRSGKRVDVAALTDALRGALGAGGEKLALVGQGETPDFTLRGTIGATEATEADLAVTYFAIDLALVDASGTTAWPFAVEHRVVGR